MVVSKEERPELDVHREMANFSNYLKRCGLKITQQRLLVAETIFALNSHFTVDSLAETLRSQKDAISRATIYRIVSLMVEAGQLTEHHFNQSVKVYEHIPRRQHHDHIVCHDCGRIDEFMDEHIERMQIEIAERLGYKLSDHALNLYGRCQELSQKGTCARRKQEGA